MRNFNLRLLFHTHHSKTTELHCIKCNSDRNKNRHSQNHICNLVNNKIKLKRFQVKGYLIAFETPTKSDGTKKLNVFPPLSISSSVGVTQPLNAEVQLETSVLAVTRFLLHSLVARLSLWSSPHLNNLQWRISPQMTECFSLKVWTLSLISPTELVR